MNEQLNNKEMIGKIKELRFINSNFDNNTFMISYYVNDNKAVAQLISQYMSGNWTEKVEVENGTTEDAIKALMRKSKLYKNNNNEQLLDQVVEDLIPEMKMLIKNDVLININNLNNMKYSIIDVYGESCSYVEFYGIDYYDLMCFMWNQNGEDLGSDDIDYIMNEDFDEEDDEDFEKIIFSANVFLSL